jgi:hypothetical protein
VETRHIKDRELLEQQVLQLSEEINSMQSRQIQQKENYKKLSGVLSDIEMVNIKR